LERAEAEARAEAEGRARVAAQARAAAERRARRLTVGLAAVVLGLVVVGGSGAAWWLQHRADLVRDVEATLAEAAQNQEAGRWTAARAALERADGRLGGGGPAALRERVRQARADSEMVAELDAIQLRQASAKDGHFHNIGADPAYATAFRKYGVDVQNLDPQEAAARIGASAIREYLVVALDAWWVIRPARDAGGRERLRIVVDLADDNAWRRQLRDPAVRSDARRLANLTRQPDVKAQPPTTLFLLGQALQDAGLAGEAIALLRGSQQQHPDDFWINYSLAYLLAHQESVGTQEAIGYYRAAAALRPSSLGVHFSLALALDDSGDLAGAIAAYRKALDCDPKYALAYFNLGLVLERKGDRDGALAAFRAALDCDPKYAPAHTSLGISLAVQGDLAGALAAFRTALSCDPNYATAHFNLGLVLERKGDRDGAMTAYRTAVDCDPKLAAAHNNLGFALATKGDTEGAVAAYRRALDCDPKYAMAHFNLGNALRDQGDVEGAIAAYRRALDCNPKYAEAHCNLGHVLRSQGEFPGSLAALRCGHELGSQRRDWSYPSAEWVQEAERLVALEAKLPTILEGKAKPANVGEILSLALSCYGQKRYATAARFYADAIAADSKVADALKAGLRYNAACCAALAAAGQGEEAAKFDGPARARLGQQARAWLCADLALRTKLLANGKPNDRTIVQEQLRHWQTDRDLASVRDAAALAALPADERAAWQQLWADVAALLQRAAK
jgi:tetratricopeptide (TPR) repeat protein